MVLCGLARIGGLFLFSGAILVGLVTLLGEAGRVFLLLDVFNHFRPFWLVGAAFILGLSVMVYGGGIFRRAAPLVALAAFVVQSMHLAPEALRLAAAPARSETGAAAAREDVLRIITLNMWGRNSHRAEAAAALRAQDPDVIVLQEAWRAQVPLVEELQKTHPHMVGCVAVSRCNVAILSRHEIIASKVHEPIYAGLDKWTVPLVRADLRLSTGRGQIDARILTSHLTWPNQIPLQRIQMAQLSDAAVWAGADRTILLGDFNSTPWSFAFRFMEDRIPARRVTLALPTWPADQRPRAISWLIGKSAGYGVDISSLYRPFLPIDHVFIGRAFDVENLKRVPIPGSDHYAVLVDVAKKAPSLAALH